MRKTQRTALVLGLGLLLVQPGMAQPAKALRARWRFDAVTNGIAVDATGNGFDATHFSKGDAAPVLADGIHGKAVVLASKHEQGFTVANSKDLNMAGPFTVMAWVKPVRRNASFAIACMKGDKSGAPPWPGWRLRFAWARANFQIGTPEGTEPGVSSPQWSVPPGFWSHVAATWDGKSLRLYVNAVEKGIVPFDGTVAPQNPGHPLILGNYIGRKNAYAFDGAIDDIRIYSTCLSGDDVFAAASSANSENPD